MSLIRCPECGNGMSSKADECQACGYKTYRTIRKFAGIFIFLGIADIIAAFVLDMIYDTDLFFTQIGIIVSIPTIILGLIFLFVFNNESDEQNNNTN